MRVDLDQPSRARRSRTTLGTPRGKPRPAAGGARHPPRGSSRNAVGAEHLREGDTCRSWPAAILVPPEKATRPIPPDVLALSVPFPNAVVRVGAYQREDTTRSAGADALAALNPLPGLRLLHGLSPVLLPAEIRMPFVVAKRHILPATKFMWGRLGPKAQMWQGPPHAEPRFSSTGPSHERFGAC